MHAFLSQQLEQNAGLSRFRFKLIDPLFEVLHLGDREQNQGGTNREDGRFEVAVHAPPGIGFVQARRLAPVCPIENPVWTSQAGSVVSCFA